MNHNNLKIKIFSLFDYEELELEPPSKPTKYWKKVKFSHTCYRALGPQLIPV